MKRILNVLTKMQYLLTYSVTKFDVGTFVEVVDLFRELTYYRRASQIHSSHQRHCIFVLAWSIPSIIANC